MTQVIGTDGPPVLLLPGGAESAEGFFPGLVEGLVEEPGCRVVLHDRPGTGSSTTPGTLADSPAALHELLTTLGLAPVVLVGQSLGGAVAAMLAREHPEDVAGLVLLDPSPINDPSLARTLERTMKTTVRLSRTPVVGRVVPPLLRLSGRGLLRRELRPDARAAALRTLDLDVDQLGLAVHGFHQAAAAFRTADLPRVPAVVVTAERKPDAAMRRAHERLALALGAPLVSWPGAQHAVHLTHPDEVLDACRSVLRQVG